MTITRTTATGRQEVFTNKGFKTREWISQNSAENIIEFFDNLTGLKKVRELRSDCRIASMKKSIILNYS